MEQGTMNGNEMSTADILQMTAELIGGICVPVAYADEIARPLAGALSNIKYLIERTRREEATGNERTEADS